MKSLSIVTPTFNRAGLLPRCYDSLKAQTCGDFEWIIIDDGSTDGTKELVEEWLRDPEKSFAIEYHWKENGGKHTALNASHPYIRGKYVLILDSDDYLVPAAVETICNTWNEFYSDKQIGCISFYKALEDGTIVSKQIGSRVVSDHISFRVNQKSGGDQCETVRSEYFKDYQSISKIMFSRSFPGRGLSRKDFFGIISGLDIKLYTATTVFISANIYRAAFPKADELCL